MFIPAIFSPLHQPLVDQATVKPNDRLIHIRIHLTVLATFGLLLALSPMTPVVVATFVVISGISAVSLVFFDFSRANKAADKLALERLELDTLPAGSSGYYPAADRIVNNQDLLNKLILNSDRKPEVLTRRFDTPETKNQNILLLASTLPTSKAFQALVKAKQLRIDDLTFKQFLLSKNRKTQDKFSYLISSSNVKNGHYQLKQETKWYALTEGPVGHIANLVGPFGLDPNMRFNGQSLLLYVVTETISATTASRTIRTLTQIEKDRINSLIRHGARATQAMIELCTSPTDELAEILTKALNRQRAAAPAAPRDKPSFWRLLDYLDG